MDKYTSLKVNKRLSEAGFQNEQGREYDGAFYSYRADTLLAWLLERGDMWQGKRDGGYAVKWLHQYGDDSGIRFDCHAPTLSDALAEVVLAVLAKEVLK